MAAALAMLVQLPLALDGESVTANNTVLAIVSVISMLGGYVVLAALWYFVFRDKARQRRSKDPRD